MLPGDRLVCAFLESHAVGEQFKKWFLHVTIVPWFRLPDSSEMIANGLERALKTIKPFEFVMGGAATFGPKHNRPATLVQEPTPFTFIEKQVRNYLHKKCAWLVDETTQKHYDFRPHVTKQGERLLEAGDTFRCDKLYIVEQKGDFKEVCGEVLVGQAGLSRDTSAQHRK